MTRSDLLQLKIKSANKLESNLYSTIIGECDRIGKNLSEQQVLTIIQKMYKTVQETYKSNNDNESLDEMELLIKLLPEVMSDDKLQTIINEYVDLQESCNIGSVLKHLDVNYTAQYNKESAINLIKESLCR